MRKVVCGIAVCMLLLPALVQAQPAEGDNEITLNGSGSFVDGFDNGSFGINGSYGKYLTDEFEASFRQSFFWADTPGSDQWFGTTRGAVDFHFDMEQFQPFVGGNVGVIYGDVDENIFVAPEVGVKYFMQEDAFLFAMVEWQFPLDSNEDDAFVYNIGIGLTW